MKETFDKIRLVIFDVDGVLVNSRNLHFPATSYALSDYGYTYTREEDELFGTIPTREKLNILSQRGCIELKDIDNIWNLKDNYACKLFDKSILVNPNIKKIFEFIKEHNIFIALGSNARYSFLEKVITRLQISELVDYIASSQDMKPKPDPYMYVNAMEKFNVSPKETLIFEDSEVGKQAAYSSKANVYEVSSYNELSLKSLSDCLKNELEGKKIKYHNLLMELPHSQRVLVNDFADSNQYPSYVALNIPRNTDNLEKYF